MHRSIMVPIASVDTTQTRIARRSGITGITATFYCTTIHSLLLDPTKPKSTNQITAPQVFKTASPNLFFTFQISNAFLYTQSPVKVFDVQSPVI
ncbi:hypothetical protein L2E82_19855 [Cichorium intybus]|uniref:Uncharacterized protein n=1 Tax=Cichorium intybus TaxID=13427 RepID=A0ACB9DRX8_CICIN|nr:hypothetical protein L2E82_19855 [Cichorium intybus]